MRIDYTLTPQARISAGRSGQVQNVRTIHEVVPGSVVRGALGAAWWGPTDARFEPASQPTFDDLFTKLMDVHAAIPRLAEGHKTTEAEFERLSWARCKYRSQPGCPDGWYDQVFAVAQGLSDWLRTCPGCGQPVEHPKQGWKVDQDWSVATVRTALTKGVATDDMLFTRRAMVREVTYTGTLQLASEPDEQVLAWLLEPKEIRVGGQRSTMGACRWEAAVAADESPEVRGDCVVELRSPAILIDDYGAPSLDLAAELNKALAAEAAGTVQRVWMRQDVVTGWHGIAGLPKPSEWVVAAGSVALITGATARTAELLATGIGLRRAEGYGQIQVCPPPSAIAVDDSTESSEEVAAAPEITEEEAKPASPLEMLEQLVPDPLLDQTRRAVFSEAQRIKQLRDGGFPDHIVTQRIAGLVSRPWMRDLSGDAQGAVKAVLSSPSLSEYLAVLNAAIGKGGSR